MPVCKKICWAAAPVRILPPPTWSPWMTALVSTGCRNGIPQTRWLKQQKFISSRFGGYRSSRSRCHQGWFLGSLSSWLVDSCRLSVSSHGLSCVHMERERSLVHLPLLRGTSVLSHAGPTLLISFNLNYCPMAPSPNTITLGVRASTYGLVGHSLVHNGELWGTLKQFWVLLKMCTTFCVNGSPHTSPV